MANIIFLPSLDHTSCSFQSLCKFNGLAVAPFDDSLYITKENISVWLYSKNPEHKRTRQLIHLEKGLGIEYVDTTVQADVVIVSPSKNRLWL